jgi:hypothetical protein|tara:strand:+ start:503 stop:946 length:444 start_codon:yes stop_codon:yes gene_type:complete
MTQFSLFKELPQKENPFVDGVVCIKCGIRQPITHYSVMKAGEIKRTCRSCRKGHKEILNKLRKENAYPDKDYSCAICDRTLEELGKHGQTRLQNWVLDHCHDTNTFRGWVCHKCNTGLGGFSDDLTIIERAVIYLKKHKERLNETNT